MVEEREAVVVARLGGCAPRIAATKPSIGNKSAEAPLIACRGEQGAHCREGASARHSAVVVVVRPDELGAHVEAVQGALGGVVAEEEFVTITEGVTHGVVLVLVVARRDEARADLAALTPLGEGALIGDLGAARRPRKEGDLHGIEPCALRGPCGCGEHYEQECCKK